jgi:hypothetical protein
MIKKEILMTLVRDRLLLDKIYSKLDIRQETISQSFKRTLEDNKIRGKSHHPEVLKIIRAHLKLTEKQLLD